MQSNTSAATCFVKLYTWNFQRVFANDFVVVGGCWWLWIVIGGCGWLWILTYFSITHLLMCQIMHAKLSVL